MEKLSEQNRRRVLYLTNIEVPYRVQFFNELAKNCDLTVLYERERSANRNAAWASGEQCRFRHAVLGGIKVKNENGFSPGILKYITAGYDWVIVGCYNSPVQMLAILYMRLLGIPYLLNVDGEVFLTGNGLKTRLKRFFLQGANGYLAAGEKAAASLAEVSGGRPVYPYWFSSLSKRELAENRRTDHRPREEFILVVGQYFGYKGMDVALDAARMDPDQHYRFVGMGVRTEQFQKDHAGTIPKNVEIIPFLQKQELEMQYRRCAMLMLPSRQECWGLVVNEAASFGTPIVSTWGSGAAVEFLAEAYPDYLAKPGDAGSLLACVRKLRSEGNRKEYGRFLMEKSGSYSIEKSVQVHLRACGIEAGEEL